jgi:hypothetical protein
VRGVRKKYNIELESDRKEVTKAGGLAGTWEME